MSFKPLGDRVLVQRVEAGEEVRGGIVIPDTAKEKPQEGVVKSVGTGRVLDSGQKVAMSVKAGDKVLFGKYSGTEIKLNNEEYLIMSEGEILGILS
jgi:chaperonin GroES